MKAKAKAKPKAKRKRGRTPKVADKIVLKSLLESLALGIPIKTSCECAGLSTTSYNRAIEAADKADEDKIHDARAKVYRDFRASATHAREEGTKLLLKTVIAHAKDDWRAAAWVLERTRPQEFGRQTKVEVAGDPEAPLRVETQPLSADEWLKKFHGSVVAAMAVPDVVEVPGGGNGRGGNGKEG